MNAETTRLANKFEQYVLRSANNKKEIVSNGAYRHFSSTFSSASSSSSFLCNHLMDIQRMSYEIPTVQVCANTTNGTRRKRKKENRVLEFAQRQ